MKRLFAAVGMVLLTACSGSTTATTIAGNSAPHSSTVPTTTPSKVTVTADNGEVTIIGEPRRIVSLSATHTEILYAIGAGDAVVATDLTSDYPPQAETTDKVDAFNFSVEAVAALQPDLAVLAFDFQGEVESLESLGIPTLLLGPAATLDDAYRQVVVLGRATFHEEEAEATADAMRSRIDAAVESFGTISGGASVYHEVDDTLFSANSATLLGDIFRRLGLHNIADAVPDEFGSGFVQLSEEFILFSDPTIIVLGDASFGVTAQSLSDRPGWETLSAVTEGRIIELIGDIPGRWGPRTPELVEDIVGAALPMLVEG